MNNSNNFSKVGGIGKRISKGKNTKDTTIKRCKKNQLSKSKRNQTGNEPDPARISEAAETPVYKKKHDLQRHDAGKTSGGKALTDAEVIRRKEAKITQTEDSQENNNFQTPPKIVYCMMLITFL